MKNKSSYELRLIAFIDILGFKEIIKQSEIDPEKIEFISSILNYLKDWESQDKWDLKLVEIEEDAQYKGVKNFDIRGKTNVTAFSDSIVVSVKIDDNINEMASTLIVHLSHIGSLLLEKGVLIRGGLTVGNLIHDDNGTVFGQGMIDAYLLETKSAKYPRIILSNKIIEALNYPIDNKINRYPYHQYLERFEDGCIGFHQLIHYCVTDGWIEMTPEILARRLEIVRKVIVQGLDSSFENPDVFEKYKWMMEKYNNLIILSDWDYETKSEENVKQKIRKLNDGIFGHNVHYSFTDSIYESRRKNKTNNG